MWNKVIIAAPAQVGNIFGFFDRAGVLCRPPPLSERSRDGGPGDLITIERIPDNRASLHVEYLKRGCDSDGYWEPIEPFTELAEDIRTHPNRSIVDYLAESTINALSTHYPELDSIRSDSLRITVVKHLPNRRVGIGLGSSASSTSIVVGIDHIYGDLLKRTEDDRRVRGLDGQHIRLMIMAEGERLVSGAGFLDNVAPLLFGGLVYIDGAPPSVRFNKLTWPEHLFLVTITPDISLTTREMRDILTSETISVLSACEAAHRRTEVIWGLLTGDIDRILAHTEDGIIEPVRWPLIHGGSILRDHVKMRRHQGVRVAIGISGSGPSVYCLTDSIEGADLIGAEVHELWKKQQIMSWWFVHKENTDGVSIVEKL